jgi:hypothetical protein
MAALRVVEKQIAPPAGNQGRQREVAAVLVAAGARGRGEVADPSILAVPRGKVV